MSPCAAPALGVSLLVNRNFFSTKGFYQFYYASLILNNTFNVVLIFSLLEQNYGTLSMSAGAVYRESIRSVQNSAGGFRNRRFQMYVTGEW